MVDYFTIFDRHQDASGNKMSKIEVNRNVEEINNLKHKDLICGDISITMEFTGITGYCITFKIF